MANSIYRPKSNCRTFCFDTRCRSNVIRTSVSICFRSIQRKWIDLSLIINKLTLLHLNHLNRCKFIAIYVSIVVQSIRKNAILCCCPWQKCWHFQHMVNGAIVILNWFEKKCSQIDLIICLNRTECEAQVKGFTGAIFKKFKTSSEADQFIAQKRTNATLTTITNAATGSVSLF